MFSFFGTFMTMTCLFTINLGGQELMQLGLAKEQMEKSFLDNKNKTTVQLEEKGNADQVKFE